MQTPQHLDPATLITALYCLVDDIYKEHFAQRKPNRPGRQAELSDSEVLTLVLLAQWRLQRSEREFGAYANDNLRSYFPRLLSQSAFNRRARDLMGVVCAMVPIIREKAIRGLGLPQAAFEVMDGVPVPLMRRCRGNRHLLFRDEAAVGRGGSDRDWFYGLKMLGAFDAYGFITGFVAGPANTEERWLAEALLRWRQDLTAPPPTAELLADVLGPAHRSRGKRQGPTGPVGPRQGAGNSIQAPFVTDLGYSGAAWGQHWRQDCGVEILTEADFATMAEPDRRKAARQLHSLRQVVETGFATLTKVFGLAFPCARTIWGVYTRLGAKAAAYNFALYINHLFGRPPFSRYNPVP
jgi:hypothetical protein